MDTKYTRVQKRETYARILATIIGPLATRVGHSYLYLITHMRRKGIYHGAIYLRNWNCLHPISKDESKFCHFR